MIFPMRGRNVDVTVDGEPVVTVPFAVYRAFDEDGDCLYVGKSTAVISRLNNHLTSSEWRDDVVRFEITSHEDAETMACVEGAEIQRLAPRCNVAYNSAGLAERRAAKAAPVIKELFAEGATWREIQEVLYHEHRLSMSLDTIAELSGWEPDPPVVYSTTRRKAKA